MKYLVIHLIYAYISHDVNFIPIMVGYKSTIFHPQWQHLLDRILFDADRHLRSWIPCWDNSKPPRAGASFVCSLLQRCFTLEFFGGGGLPKGATILCFANIASWEMLLDTGFSIVMFDYQDPSDPSLNFGGYAW